MFRIARAEDTSQRKAVRGNGFDGEAASQRPDLAERGGSVRAAWPQTLGLAAEPEPCSSSSTRR